MHRHKTSRLPIPRRKPYTAILGPLQPLSETCPRNPPQPNPILVRIVINTLPMKCKLHGEGNYIKNLVWSLSRIDSANEYILLASRDNLCHLTGLPGSFQVQLAPSAPAQRILWEQTVLPVRLKRHKVDLYHGFAFGAPLFKVCPEILTVYDASVQLTPERHSFPCRAFYRDIVPFIIKGSDGIIAVSRSAKADLLDVPSLPQKKISVIPLGVDPQFRPIHDPYRLEQIRHRYSLPRDFILYVGMIEPRKNLDTLVDAYLSDSLASRFDLVLAGGPGRNYSGLLQKIHCSGAAHCIRLPGYIPDADLPALYTAASAFVYPSLYESFGLPVLEAMACGTPVVTSSVSSLPEVAGAAALFTDPHDSEALAAALKLLLNNQNLRTELSMRGLQRARSFTWQQTARDTLALYHRIAQHQPYPTHVPHPRQAAQSSV
jgi:glycosyltransferase involved in cell wall biosynthesis